MDRHELLKALKTALPGTDKESSLLEAADSFVLDNSWIRTYNEQISVSVPFESGIRAVAKAQELYKVVGKMDGDSVRLFVQNGQLILQDRQTTLEMNAPDKLPDTLRALNTDGLTWAELPADFMTGIRLCLTSASTNSLFTAINGICFSGPNILSTDNFRVSWYEIPGMDMGYGIIPTPAVKELLKLGNDFKEISRDASWIHFRDSAGTIFSCRLMEGNFPLEKSLKLFDMEFSEVYTFPHGIYEAADRAAIMASAKESEFSGSPFITITRKENTLVVKGNKDIGRLTDKVRMGQEPFPAEFELLIPPNSLKALLEMAYNFQLGDLKGRTLILFQTDNFSHLVSGRAKTA